MTYTNDEKNECMKYVPTKKLNLYHGHLGKNLIKNNLLNESSKNRLIKSKSNADVSNILPDSQQLLQLKLQKQQQQQQEKQEQQQKQAQKLAKNNDVTNRSSETKRIYENEFSMKSRAKSVDTSFLIRDDEIVETIQSNNENSNSNKNFKSTTTSSTTNYNLNNFAQVPAKNQEMLHTTYRRINNRPMDTMGYFNRQTAYQYQPSIHLTHRRYRGNLDRQFSDFDWNYEIEKEKEREREKLERSELIRSRKGRRANIFEDYPHSAEFLTRPLRPLDTKNNRSRSNDSKLNDNRFFSSSSTDESVNELNKRQTPVKIEPPVVETAVQTLTEKSETESKLVNELKSQMDVLKAEIARLQNAQTNLEKNLKQQVQQQSTILRPIIYSGSGMDQTDYNEYTLDQFIQTEDPLFTQTMTSYADFFNVQNQAVFSSLMNPKQFLTGNLIQAKPQQVINKPNEIKNQIKTNSGPSIVPNPHQVPKNLQVQNDRLKNSLPNQNQLNQCMQKKPVLNQQKVNINNPNTSIQSQNVEKKMSPPQTTQLNVNTNCDQTQNSPISPNAQLYQKLLKLVSDSVDFSDSELSKQMNTLLSNPHIKTRLKQLHTQLLQDPKHYWPKLENILLFDNQGKETIKYQNVGSIQNKLQNVIQDLVDLKKYYSDASQNINKQQLPTQPRIINR